MYTRKLTTIFLSVLLLIIPIILIASTRISEFRARREGNVIILEWATESESNVEKFNIQRSVDTINWHDLDSVPSKNGNSTTRQSYIYRDNNIFKATSGNFNYRLIIIDQKGNSSLYNVVASASGYSGIKHTWGSLKAMFR